MKIEIIDVSYVTDDGALTLEECGFKVGDVVEVSGRYFDGEICETKFASIGNEVSIGDHEYKVIEE